MVPCLCVSLSADELEIRVTCDVFLGAYCVCMILVLTDISQHFIGQNRKLKYTAKSIKGQSLQVFLKSYQNYYSDYNHVLNLLRFECALDIKLQFKVSSYLPSTLRTKLTSVCVVGDKLTLMYSRQQ